MPPGAARPQHRHYLGEAPSGNHHRYPVTHVAGNYVWRCDSSLEDVLAPFFDFISIFGAIRIQLAVPDDSDGDIERLFLSNKL